MTASLSSPFNYSLRISLVTKIYMPEAVLKSTKIQEDFSNIKQKKKQTITKRNVTMRFHAEANPNLHVP